MPARRARDVVKVHSTKEFVARLRRLADALEAGRAMTLQVAGERLTIPADAHCSIEHERAGGVDEVEFQVRWKRG